MGMPFVAACPAEVFTERAHVSGGRRRGGSEFSLFFADNDSVENLLRVFVSASIADAD
jgi:hypothetical protein